MLAKSRINITLPRCSPHVANDLVAGITSALVGIGVNSANIHIIGATPVRGMFFEPRFMEFDVRFGHEPVHDTIEGGGLVRSLTPRERLDKYLVGVNETYAGQMYSAFKQLLDDGGGDVINVDVQDAPSMLIPHAGKMFFFKPTENDDAYLESISTWELGDVLMFEEFVHRMIFVPDYVPNTYFIFNR